jgi:flagellar biosynthetic protein FlhB
MSGDRTLPATPRRREQARRRGLLPTAAALAWAVSAAALTACLPDWLRHVSAALVDAVAEAALGTPWSPGDLAEATIRLAWRLSSPTLLVIAAVAAAGLTVRALIDRPRLRLERLASWERLSLPGGCRRLTSPETLWRFAGATLVMVVVTVAAASAFAPLAGELRKGELAIDHLPTASAWLAWRGVWGVLAAAAVAAAGEHAFRWWRSEQRLRMTPAELREEQRLVEADPRVRLPLRDSDSGPTPKTAQRAA